MRKMLPRGLILAVTIGVVAGPILGIILYETNTHEQLVYVDGSGISILTEKIDFDLGEEIHIKIVNSSKRPSRWLADSGSPASPMCSSDVIISGGLGFSK